MRGAACEHDRVDIGLEHLDAPRPPIQSVSMRAGPAATGCTARTMSRSTLPARPSGRNCPGVTGTAGRCSSIGFGPAARFAAVF
jgi:hypothetical protein